MTTVLLLQARRADDPMRLHEVDRFAFETGLGPETLRPLNLAVDPFGPEVLLGVDAVMVGGSGDFSVAAGGFDWHEPMLALMRAVAASRVPTFASCFGHQALAQALGGRVETAVTHTEVGTFEVRLTGAGRRDPLFGQLPEAFEAQLGHKDAVTVVPPGLEVLAGSERCPVQAMRLTGAPVVTTQFHPELDMTTNRERFLAYLAGYKRADETLAQATARTRAAFRPSPHASALLGLFVRAHGLVP